MTISANYIGTSTVQISVTFNTGESTANFTPFNTFRNCIKDAILGTQPGAGGIASGVAFTQSSGVTAQTTSGWTLIEESWGGLTAANWGNAASVTYTQVFKALNNDAKSYKCVIIRYKTDVQEIHVSTCEKWDAATHTPSNEVYTFQDCCPINYNLTACDFIINVSPRWILFHSYICNESTRWAAIVETDREAFEDVCDSGYPYTAGTVGIPNWGLINSVIPTLGFNTNTNGALNASTQLLWCVPKTKSGYTGINAAIKWGADYGLTSYPTWMSGVSQPAMAYQMGNIPQKFQASGWDLNKRVILPLKPIYDYTTNPINYGMIHGLKTLSPVGTNMNKIQLNVDTNGNAASPGTARDHWLLNLTGIPLNASFGSANATLTKTDKTSGGVNACGIPIKFISVGSKVYILNSLGLHKYDIASKVESQIFPSLGSTDTTLLDMAFDGERYLYFTSSVNTASLKRLDTLDDTTISVYSTIISTGLAGVAVNGDTVIACQNTPTTPNWYRFTKQASTGTVTALAAKSGSAGTVTSPTVVASPANILYNTGIDSDGSFYFAARLNTGIFGKLAYNGIASIAAASLWGNPTYTYTAGRFSYNIVGLDHMVQIRQSTTVSAAPTITVQRCSTNTTLYNAAFSNTAGIGNTSGSGSPGGNTLHNDICYINGRIQIPNMNDTTYNAGYTGDIVVCIANCEIPSASVQGAMLDGSIFPTQVLYFPSVSSSLTQKAMYFDGARIFLGAPTSTVGYRVVENVNGGRTLGSVFGNTTNLAQFAIPA